jgi:hypothetical protein
MHIVRLRFCVCSFMPKLRCGNQQCPAVSVKANAAETTHLTHVISMLTCQPNNTPINALLYRHLLICSWRMQERFQCERLAVERIGDTCTRLSMRWSSL